MSAIFESKTLGPTERLVMLALADHADDATNECFPSMRRLCERTGLGERAVQMNITKLVKSGLLKMTAGGGRGNSNLYQITLNPAPDAPIKTPHQMHPIDINPASNALNPASNALNPAPDAPEPLRTIREPRKVRTREARDVSEALCEVVSQATADAYIAHRKAKRAKLTPHAAQLIAGKIRGHPDPDSVLLESIANGWTGVFPKPQNGATNDQPTQSTKRIDPAIEQIARLAGLGQAQGNGSAGTGSHGQENGPLRLGSRPQ